MSESEPAGPFAKYRPVAQLGKGGMAQVFLALASGPAGFSKLVVIKQIRSQFAEDPEFLAMFLDEARLAARLNHPNVVQTNEVGGDGGRFCICMEYLEGQPLNRLLSRVGQQGGLTLGMQLRILVDALAGLHHAHELVDFDGKPLEVVHRDATPHNIFLTYAGQVKVVDFGIAKALNSSTETRVGVLKGKIGYMAPEQARGEPVDRRADVFAMGMVLWEVLAGRRAFKGLEDVAVLQKIVTGAIPSPCSVRPDIPELLEAICKKAIARAPADRYASAMEMAAAIESAADELGLNGTPRDAGKLIEAFFAADRDGLRRLVEAQVVRLREGGGDADAFARAGGGASSLRLPVVDPHATDASSTLGEPGATSPSARRTRGSGAGSGSVATRKFESSHPSSLAAATASPSEAQSPSQGRVAAAVLALAVGAVAAVAVVSSRGGPPSATASSSAPVDAPKARNVLIDSTPQGATVREGESELGTTPMMLPIDPAAPPRRLVMSLDGYAPHAFRPTSDELRLVVPLARVGSPPANPALATSAGVPAAPEKGLRPASHPSAPPKPSAPTPALDINMAR
jgi:serine/threonine-protein kinase